jgi:hypothetical protein
LGWIEHLTSEAVLVNICIGNTTGEQSFNCTYVTTDIFYYLSYVVSPTAEYTAMKHMLPDTQNGTQFGPIEFYVFDAATSSPLYHYKSPTSNSHLNPGPGSRPIWLSDHVVMFYEGGEDPSFTNTYTIVYDLQSKMEYVSQNSWLVIDQNDFMSGVKRCQNMFAAYRDTNLLVIWDITTHTFKEIDLVAKSNSDPNGIYYVSEDCTYLYFSLMISDSISVNQFNLLSFSVTGTEILPGSLVYFLYGSGNVIYLAQPQPSSLRRIEFLSSGKVDNKIIMTLENQEWGPSKEPPWTFPFWGSNYVQQGKMVVPYHDPFNGDNDNGNWYFLVVDLEL